MTCANPACDDYPYYGVAPHECFYKKGAEFMPGQSTLLHRHEWPSNFVLDIEPGEDPATIEYPNACGVYYCPTCEHGLGEARAKLAKLAAQGIDARSGETACGLDPKGESPVPERDVPKASIGAQPAISPRASRDDEEPAT